MDKEQQIRLDEEEYLRLQEKDPIKHELRARHTKLGEEPSIYLGTTEIKRLPRTDEKITDFTNQDDTNENITFRVSLDNLIYFDK